MAKAFFHGWRESDVSYLVIIEGKSLEDFDSEAVAALESILHMYGRDGVQPTREPYVFQGLDHLITTGYQDADTKTRCPPLPDCPVEIDVREDCDVRDFYEGGMILFDPDLAYQYECHLAAFLKHRREKYFVRGASHAWLYWLMLDEYDRKRALGQYTRADYHMTPGDPLVALPDVPDMLWLKRRKLRVLEFQAFKVARRTPWISKHK